MPTKKIFTPRKTQGYGYAGLWITGDLGWFSPRHVSNSGRKYPQGVNPEALEHIKEGQTDRFYLCKVTIEPVFDKKGRPITTIVKGKR